jgi:hypothetical protein
MDNKNKKGRPKQEVGLFLDKIKNNSQVLVDLKLIKTTEPRELFTFLAMNNCKHNWYRCGIPKKYKVINSLLKLLKEHHEKAQELQEQVNELLKGK